MVERLAPTGSLRYAMDANFLYVSYAASYLIQVSLNYFAYAGSHTDGRGVAHAAKIRLFA